MSASLVGSEMCIRDRSADVCRCASVLMLHAVHTVRATRPAAVVWGLLGDCLLYTSDAADDM
eukprot:7992382-Alexandrium_andersonii.AAC.1